jgi:hypothetical protein
MKSSIEHTLTCRVAGDLRAVQRTRQGELLSPAPEIHLPEPSATVSLTGTRPSASALPADLRGRRLDADHDAGHQVVVTWPSLMVTVALG